MSDFIKYVHLERFGTDEVDGINIGKCHIFPKIDGTNASIWLEDGVFCCGSRNRVLSLDDDNAGFMAWATGRVELRALLDSLPAGSRVYGEWLVPHSLRTYRDDAWRRFYVFDVLLPDGEFMHFDDYSRACSAASAGSAFSRRVACIIATSSDPRVSGVVFTVASPGRAARCLHGYRAPCSARRTIAGSDRARRRSRRRPSRRRRSPPA